MTQGPFLFSIRKGNFELAGRFRTSMDALFKYLGAEPQWRFESILVAAIFRIRIYWPAGVGAVLFFSRFNAGRVAAFGSSFRTRILAP